MSGHSKWANIKHKKARSDAKRGKVFTKLGREIMLAVKEGGDDPNLNTKLKDVIAKARAANMPGDNIKRSIDKAAGNIDGIQYEEIVYEGYGPGGVAFIVDAMTENRNRTAADVRHAFDKNGGNLGASGCVAWMFDRKGIIIVEKDKAPDEEELMMIAIDAGAEDFTSYDEAYEIQCDPADFSAVREALESQDIEMMSAELQKIPQNTVAVEGEMVEKIETLIDFLEDNDDVQNVYHNAEFEEE